METEFVQCSECNVGSQQTDSLDVKKQKVLDYVKRLDFLKVSDDKPKKVKKPSVADTKPLLN